MPKKAKKANAPRQFVEFVGDKNGQCYVFYKDNIRIAYKGKCTDGIPNGDGQIQWHNGFHYNGTFHNGEPCGPGVLTSPYGTAILCKSFNGMIPNGRCMITTVDSKKHVHTITTSEELESFLQSHESNVNRIAEANSLRYNTSVMFPSRSRSRSRSTKKNSPKKSPETSPAISYSNSYYGI